MPKAMGGAAPHCRKRSWARPVMVALLVTLLGACGSGSDGVETERPRFPSLGEMPVRPEGLPDEASLEELRLRLEEDRAAALGEDPLGEEPAAAEEPLPELSSVLDELPVEPQSAGLVDPARSGVSVQVATVFFPAESTAFDQPVIDVLSKVAREQQAIGGSLRVIGQRGRESSDDLALRQLAEIGQTLVRMGVPPTRIGTELGEPDGLPAGDHGRAVIYLDY